MTWFRAGGGGGSTKIENGIIESYFSDTSDILPNTFVEIIDSLSGSTGAKLQSDIYHDGKYEDMGSCKYNDNILVVCYGEYIQAFRMNDDKTITAGTKLRVYDSSDVDYENSHKSVVIKSGYIYIFSDYRYYVLTLNENTLAITLKNVFTPPNGTGGYRVQKYTGVGNYVWTIYNDYVSGTWRWYICISTLTPTSLVDGTSVVYQNGMNGVGMLESVEGNSNSVFMTFLAGNNREHYIMYASRSGTTVTVSSNYIQAVNQSKNGIRIVPLTNTTAAVFYVKNYDADVFYFHLKYSSGSLTKSTEVDTGIDSYSNTSYSQGLYLGVALLSDGNIALLTANKTSGKNSFYIITAPTSGKPSVVKSLVVGSKIGHAFLWYMKESLLIACNTVYESTTESDLYVIDISRMEKGIKEATTKIDGVTKTKATPSSKGDVWVLA